MGPVLPAGSRAGCRLGQAAAGPAEVASSPACLSPPWSLLLCPSPCGVHFMCFLLTHKKCLLIRGLCCNSLERGRLWGKPAAPSETWSSDRIGVGSFLSQASSLSQPGLGQSPDICLAAEPPAALSSLSLTGGPWKTPMEFLRMVSRRVHTPWCLSHPCPWACLHGGLVWLRTVTHPPILLMIKHDSGLAGPLRLFYSLWGPLGLSFPSIFWTWGCSF